MATRIKQKNWTALFPLRFISENYIPKIKKKKKKIHGGNVESIKER